MDLMLDGALTVLGRAWAGVDEGFEALAEFRH